MQDLIGIFVWASLGLTSFTLALLALGRQTARLALADRPVFFAAMLVFMLAWPLALAFAMYTAMRRMQMLRWMAKHYQRRSRMAWDDCWQHAVIQFNQCQEWGDLTLFPTPEWTEDGAQLSVEADLECWEGD